MTTPLNLKFDKSKAGNTDFAPIPEGTYEVIIDRGEVKTASTGTPGINFMIKIRSDIEGQAYGGRTLFYSLWFSEKTEGIQHGFLEAIGTPDDHPGFTSLEQIRDYALGRAVSAKVAITTYQGKQRNETKYINASKVGGGRVDDPFAVHQPQVGAVDPFAPQDNQVPPEDPFAYANGPIPISEDDLPY